MGITGLLPFLEKSSRKTNISEFAGGTVAIDSYCWLHKGVFSCAEKLLMGQTTNAYVLYCMKFINMLLKYHIKPILVFDGRRLPAKKQTEIKRRKCRETNRRKATELIQMGQVTEGKNLLKRAIDITHEIALELIKHCQNENIDCIVAPYEADAQLAYLNISGIADIVITEDSDLTLFGCKKMFFKMDPQGNGVLIEQSKLYLAMDVRPEQFDMDKFRYICILSGCDYLPSLPGIGLGKARKFITKNTDDNIHKALTRMGPVLNMKSLVVTEEYRNLFILADITFKHQLVFCPLQRKQVRLNPPTPNITEDQLKYAGKELDADLALQLAFGNCDPSNLKKLHDFNPDKIERKRKRNEETHKKTINHNSIWSNKYELKSKDHTSTSADTTGFSITIRKELQDSLKDSVQSKLHNSPVIQNDVLLERQKLNKEILDMYNRENSKSIISPEKFPEQILQKGDLSPDLLKQKNPFVKQVSNITTSPSILSNGNYRKRGRNLMRIRQTIIDENIIVESKYFPKTNDERYNMVKLENNTKNINSPPKNSINSFKSKHCNVTPEKDINPCNNNANQKGLGTSVKDLTEDLDRINDELNNSIKQDEYLINPYRNISEESCSNYSMTEISPTIQCTTIDTNLHSDNLLTPLNSKIERINDSNNHENKSILQDNLSNWSNTKNYTALHKQLGNRKKSSTNLISRVNSATKQTGQNKRQLPARNQCLLSMYGFQKRSTLKQ